PSPEAQPTRRAGRSTEPLDVPQGAAPAAGLSRPPAAETPSPQLGPSPTSSAVESIDSPWWPWLLAALAGLAAVGGAAWAWRQRTATRLAVAPQIERPRVAPEP